MIDYARIEQTARRIAMRLPNWTTVDGRDLAQEGALCALQGRQSRDGPMLDLLRRQGWIKNHRSSNPYQRVTLIDSTSWTSPEKQWSAAADVHHLIAHLAPKQSQAITLHYLEGMTDNEMSKALGIPIRRVRNRIFNGLKNMRRMIQ